MSLVLFLINPVTAGIFRFVCHIPLGVLGFRGRNLYRTVRHLEIYDHLYHGQELLKGLKLLAYAVLDFPYIEVLV